MKRSLIIVCSFAAASLLVGCAGTAPDDGPEGIPAPAGTGAESVYEAQSEAIRQLGY